MRFELLRPEGLTAEAWHAVEYYRKRLADAVLADDRPGVVGAAKELIECVARCVLDATERPVGDKENFNGVIGAAQKTLERAAGRDISMSPEVKVIAGSAQNIALRANVIRNRVGTGHGRARVADIDDEMAEIAGDAAMLEPLGAASTGAPAGQLPHPPTGRAGQGRQPGTVANRLRGGIAARAAS